MKGKRNVEVWVKLITQTPLKHQIFIKGLNEKDLQSMEDMYVFEIIWKRKDQQLRVKLAIHREIIHQREDTKRDIARINFTEEAFDILIERDYSLNNIKKDEDKYFIKYKSNQFQFKVEVENCLSASYYEEIVESQTNQKNVKYINDRKQRATQNKVKKPKKMRKKNKIYCWKMTFINRICTIIRTLLIVMEDVLGENY